MLRKQCALHWLCEHKFIDPSLFAVDEIGEAARNANPIEWTRTITYLAAYMKKCSKRRMIRIQIAGFLCPTTLGITFKHLVILYYNSVFHVIQGLGFRLVAKLNKDLGFFLTLIHWQGTLDSIHNRDEDLYSAHCGSCTKPPKLISCQSSPQCVSFSFCIAYLIVSITTYMYT